MCDSLAKVRSKYSFMLTLYRFSCPCHNSINNSVSASVNVFSNFRKMASCCMVVAFVSSCAADPRHVLSNLRCDWLNGIASDSVV